jgi:hypothetical protein
MNKNSRKKLADMATPDNNALTTQSTNLLIFTGSVG